MADYFGKAFFKLYPSKPKLAPTPEGQSLRKLFGMAMVLHIVFFVVSLTAMGFLPMLAEIGFSLWAFSCYLTLREWEVVVYLVALLGSIIYGVLNLFGQKGLGKENS